MNDEKIAGLPATPDLPPPPPEEYPRTFGNYLLMAPLARGGMGEVFLAKHGTVAGLVDGEATGDGVVLAGGDVAGDPALYPAAMASCTITNSDRAGVLASGVQIDATGNTLSGSGYASEGILLQDGAQNVGSDSTTDLDSAGVNLTFSLDLAPVDELKD